LGLKLHALASKAKLKVQFNQLTETWLYFRINEQPSHTDISYCGLGLTSREIQLDH